MLAGDLAAELEAQAAALRLPWVDAAACRGRGLATVAAGERMARIGSPKPRRRSTHWATSSTRPGRGCGTGGRCSGPVGGGGRPTCSPRPATASPAMSATPWVEQATAELERVAPGRATGALTEDEARIAALVAKGGATARSPPTCT